MTTVLTPPPSIDDVTRRDLLRGIGALGAGWVLASCGTAAPRRGGPGATREAVGADGGVVTVPADPQRVVAADQQSLARLLDLGVVPVAAGTTSPGLTGERDFNPALYPLGAGEVQPLLFSEPDYELIATLEPDLVVMFAPFVDGGVAGGVGPYEELAPLAVFDGEGAPLEQLRNAARIVGRERRAEEVIAEFDAGLEARAADVAVDSVSVVKPGDESSFITYTAAEEVTGMLARLLGITVVPGPEEADEYGEIESSLEQLSEVADYLTYGGNGGLARLREELIEMADFLASPAGRAAGR